MILANCMTDPGDEIGFPFFFSDDVERTRAVSRETRSASIPSPRRISSDFFCPVTDRPVLLASALIQRRRPAEQVTTNGGRKRRQNGTTRPPTEASCDSRATRQTIAEAG